MRSRKSRLLIALLLLGFLAACSTQSQVVRRRGELMEEGRLISPEAYAWFARGLHHEHAGKKEQAARDFGAAVAADRKSGMAWAAWGRVTCPRSPEVAAGIFRAGLQRALRKAPILLERARCQLETTFLLTSETGEETTLPAHVALEDARAALALEPRNPEVNRLLSACFRAAGSPKEAEQIERAYRLFMGEPTTPELIKPIEGIDRALLAGDLKQARALALTIFTPGELAARAALWGKKDIARDQASFVLSADPDDIDSQVTLQVLRSENPETVSDFPELPLARANETIRGLSASAVVLLYRYLARRVGQNTAQAFVEQHGELLRDAHDPVLDRFIEEPPRAVF